MPSFHDLPRDDVFDDKKVKKNPPNHLASRLELQAAAGASLPTSLVEQVARLEHLTEQVQQAFCGLITEELSKSCQVVFATEHRLTLALPSVTTVNHLRYLQADCLAVLKQNPNLCQYREIRFVVKPTKKHTQSQNNSKKPLSENTRHTITQYANTVIMHEALRQSLLNLAQSMPTSDKNPQ